MIDGLISIIMPSWNSGKFISESIQSVIDQTYNNWELLIVDDCSTDNTKEVIGQFSYDQRIKYFRNQKKLGAALTRNRALREAKGEWIAFLDSDDLWHPQKLEHQLNFMKKNNYSFSYHEFERIDENSKPLGIYVTGPDIVTKREIYHYDYIGQLTMMYSAKEFELIQIRDIPKNNDYALRLQLFNKKIGVSCHLLNENLAQYRVREKSVSHDKITKKIKSHFDLFYLCDNKSFISALLLTCTNMFYGIIKKSFYEKKVSTGIASIYE